jgi:hypothetical protein
MSIASSVFPAVYCTCFRFLGLILRSLIHFELILVQGYRHGSSFSFLQADNQFSKRETLLGSSNRERREKKEVNMTEVHYMYE